MGFNSAFKGLMSTDFNLKIKYCEHVNKCYRQAPEFFGSASPT